MRFKKTVAHLKKIYRSSPTNIESKYEEVEFGKPVAEYMDYLNDVMVELKNNITQKFEEISLSTFINLFLNDNEGKAYEKDDFKFLIRFIAIIETFHDKSLGKDDNLTLPDKLNRLDFPSELKDELVQLNSLRNRIVHKGYEMAEEEGTQIYDTYYEFIKYLLDKKIKPLIDKELQDSGYQFLEIKDIYQEISIYLQKYFYEQFSPNTAIFRKVREVIRELFLW